MKKTAVFCLALALLAGCGVKPNNVDPPYGANKGDFPKVYPEDMSDPAADAAKIDKR